MRKTQLRYVLTQEAASADMISYLSNEMEDVWIVDSVFGPVMWWHWYSYFAYQRENGELSRSLAEPQQKKKVGKKPTQSAKWKVLSWKKHCFHTVVIYEDLEEIWKYAFLIPPVAIGPAWNASEIGPGPTLQASLFSSRFQALLDVLELAPSS